MLKGAGSKAATKQAGLGDILNRLWFTTSGLHGVSGGAKGFENAFLENLVRRDPQAQNILANFQQQNPDLKLDAPGVLAKALGAYGQNALQQHIQKNPGADTARKTLTGLEWATPQRWVEGAGNWLERQGVGHGKWLGKHLSGSMDSAVDVEAGPYMLKPILGVAGNVTGLGTKITQALRTPQALLRLKARSIPGGALKLPTFSWWRGPLAGASTYLLDKINSKIPGAYAPGTGPGSEAKTLSEEATNAAARLNESWWKPQARSLRNIAVGGVGGAPAGAWGAVPGAIMGALKEPLQKMQDIGYHKMQAEEAQLQGVNDATNWIFSPRSMTARPTGSGTSPLPAELTSLQKFNLPHVQEALKKTPEVYRQVANHFSTTDNLKAIGDSAVAGLGLGAGVVGLGLAGMGIKKLFTPKKKPVSVMPNVPKVAFLPNPTNPASVPQGLQPPKSLPGAKPIVSFKPIQPLKPLAPVSGKGYTGTFAMPSGANRTGAGWQVPANSESGSRQVAFQPSAHQALGQAIPGFPTMTHTQKADALRQMPKTDTGVVTDPGAAPWAADGTRQVKEFAGGQGGGSEYDPGKDTRSWMQPQLQADGSRTIGRSPTPERPKVPGEVPRPPAPASERTYGTASVRFVPKGTPMATSGRIMDETGDHTAQTMANVAASGNPEPLPKRL